MKRRHAFTLIEMLVVIAIISIVATMVVHMGATAKIKQRQALVDAEKSKLTLLIDNYQSRLNFYPPDNGNNTYNATNSPFSVYDANAATNPLLYELTGATNNYPINGDIQLFDSTNLATSYSIMFGRGGVANANQDTPPKNFFNGGPAPQDYASYGLYSGQTSPVFNGLIVPAPITVTLSTNFWHYDSSSPIRHNPQSYDLWAEYLTTVHGSNFIVTNGNW